MADLPPDYTSTDALAYAQTPDYTPFPSLKASICSNAPNCLYLSCDISPSTSLFFDEKSLYADIDFGFDEAGVKLHAKKKAKATAKKPAMSNAIDEGDKKPEETSGGGDGGGGDPPADGSAGGGDGGDEKGGDDSGKKGKKKSKKEVEEEERLKKEEEERVAKEEEERLAKEEEEQRLAKEAEEEAERKRKEEEDAAAAAAAATSAANDLSWAQPAPTNDDWGSFAAPAVGKKKKGKKGKVRHLGYVMTSSRTLTLA
jgi:flagellar biosynthesis GTPase FlhF